MEYYANTDVGKLRSLNEDSYLVKSYGDNDLLAIIADGMGGHNAGEKASSMAVEEFCNLIDAEFSGVFKSSERKIFQILQKVVKKVNKKIYSVATSDTSFRGMGTTLVACIIHENHFYVANVGDSRMYLLSGDSMKQITKDHSFVAELLDMGVITREQALVHPKKNVITRAVGSEVAVDSDVFSGTAEKGSYLLMCTDGLINMVSEEVVFDTFKNHDKLNDIGNKLIEMANENGGKDNISVVIVRF